MSIGGGDEIGTADVYDSPYFGRIGSGSIGRRMDREYEQSLSSGIPYPSTGEPRLNPGVTPMPGGKGGGKSACHAAADADALLRATGACACWPV